MQKLRRRRLLYAKGTTVHILQLMVTLWLQISLFVKEDIYIYTVEITNVVWSRTLWNCVLPKHVAEAPLMFILIKDVHLFGIINYVRRTHTCLRPTDKFASVQRRARTHTHIYIYVCVYVQTTSMSVQLHIHSYLYVQHTSMRQFNCTYICVCPVYQYVSSTAHTLLCVRPTHQYGSVQLHIYMCMSNIPVTAHTLLCVRPTHQYASVQLHIHSYVYVQHTSMRQFKWTYMCTSNIPVCFRSTANRQKPLDFTRINVLVSKQLSTFTPIQKTNYICISKSSKFSHCGMIVSKMNNHSI